MYVGTFNFSPGYIRMREIQHESGIISSTCRVRESKGAVFHEPYACLKGLNQKGVFPAS